MVRTPTKNVAKKGWKRDRKRLQELDSVLKRTDITEEQRFEATLEEVGILYKYDALNVQQSHRLRTLDDLKALQEIAAKHPTNAEEKKMQDVAKQLLAYYENRLFPSGKLPN